MNDTTLDRAALEAAIASEDWSVAGPIIEGAMICLTRAAFPDPEYGHMPWYAESVEGLFVEHGDSAVEAALRCYIAMKKM